MADRDTLAIGPFRLFRNERLLTLAGRPLSLPVGAVDLLDLLLARPGQDLPAPQLAAALAQRHPGRPLDLDALAQALNDALQQGSARHFIASMDEQTYCFQGDITRPDPGEGAARLQGAQPGALPVLPRDLIGREALIARASSRLREHRLVSLLGAGGVGKTSAAVAIAQAAQAGPDSFPDGVCFVDLAPVRQPGAVGQAVLLALGLEPGQGQSAVLAQQLQDLLAHKRLLLVLDNCEHVVREAAHVAEIVLRASGVTVLATSREPLCTFGEVRLPVGPLELPPAAMPAEPAAAPRYAAVDLFMATALRSGAAASDLDAQLALAYDICRRLDGIPLALELAGAQVPSLGLEALKQHLLKWPVASLGPAAAVAGRHATLEAMFDWSHHLLSDAERSALRRLAVFRGEFPLEVALEVMRPGEHDGPADPADPADPATDHDGTAALFGLQNKSMLGVRVVGEQVFYRLLETTRDYALQKLDQDPDHALVRRRHALAFMHRLQAAEGQWRHMNGRAWLAQYGRHLDDVRQAVDWGLGASGDVEAAVELVISALPLASRLALFEEAHTWLERALAAVVQAAAALQATATATATATAPGNAVLDPLELRLLVSFRGMAAHTRRSFDALPGSDARILELVERVGDDRHTAGACMSVWFAGMNRAHYASAAAAAERQLAYAERSGSDVDRIDALKVAAYALHFLGDQPRADAFSQRALALVTNNLPAAYYNVVGCDVRVSMRIVQARVLWLSGRFGQAARMTQEALAMALEDRPLAVCLVLSYVACPLAFWNGQQAEARGHVAQLAQWSREHQLGPHEDWAKWFGLLVARGGAVVASDVPASFGPPDAMQADMLATLGCDWLVDQTAGRMAQGQVGWCSPEVMRRQGLRLLAQGQPVPARAAFTQALEAARAAGAHAWALRAALSLAQLDADEGDQAAVVARLQPLRQQVDFAAGTADVRQAEALLHEARMALA